MAGGATPRQHKHGTRIRFAFKPSGRESEGLFFDRVSPSFQPSTSMVNPPGAVK
jgi:hypothetical protein